MGGWGSMSGWGQGDWWLGTRDGGVGGPGVVGLKGAGWVGIKGCGDQGGRGGQNRGQGVGSSPCWYSLWRCIL